LRDHGDAVRKIVANGARRQPSDISTCDNSGNVRPPVPPAALQFGFDDIQLA
jgi:hypothetical protein